MCDFTASALIPALIHFRLSVHVSFAHRRWTFLFRQDLFMSSPGNVSTSLSRNQIKKSMSDRAGKSPDSASSSPTHPLSASPKLPLSASSSSRTLSHSDQSGENTPKKSSPLSFHLFDSILQRSLSKPLTINTSQETTKKLPPSPSSGSSTQAQMPEQARCLHSYNAIKEDEICVQKGEFVQIVAANQDNRWFVHRDANRTSPAAEGWIPGFVLGLKHPNAAAATPHHLSPSPPPTTLQRPTISYESTLPPKAQPSTCDKV